MMRFYFTIPIGLSNYTNVVHHHVPLLAQDLYEKIVYIRQIGAQGPIEVVGHSVGAHVAGQTGKLLQKFNGNTLDKIFGNF